MGVCILWNLEPLASGGQSGHKLIPHIICQFLYAWEKNSERGLILQGIKCQPAQSSHVQKIKSPFGILKNLPSQKAWILRAVQAGRVFANGMGDLGSIPCWFILKTLKMVLDTFLLNIQQYKVRIKGKVEQSKERSSALPTPWCSSYGKRSLLVALDNGHQLYNLFMPSCTLILHSYLHFLFCYFLSDFYFLHCANEKWSFNRFISTIDETLILC